MSKCVRRKPIRDITIDITRELCTLEYSIKLSHNSIIIWELCDICVILFFYDYTLYIQDIHSFFISRIPDRLHLVLFYCDYCELLYYITNNNNIFKYYCHYMRDIFRIIMIRNLHNTKRYLPSGDFFFLVTSNYWKSNYYFVLGAPDVF